MSSKPLRKVSRSTALGQTLKRRVSLEEDREDPDVWFMLRETDALVDICNSFTESGG